MSQNTSSAVMQQRTEAHDSLDDFPTPPWATRALFEHVILPNTGLLGRHDLRRATAWEPCANRGHMALPLQEYFGRTYATDIHDYGMGYPQHDFLMPYLPPHFDVAVDWIVTNPPFRLAEQIIQRGRDEALQGVAVLVRSAFLEGVDRYNTLFSISPPTLVAQFAERVIMHKGVLRDPNKEYWDERTQSMKRPSTATSYTWLVWCVGMPRKPPIWIPPCRRQLERAGDYPNG
jgi:hypothetical protein